MKKALIAVFAAMVACSAAVDEKPLPPVVENMDRTARENEVWCLIVGSVEDPDDGVRAACGRPVYCIRLTDGTSDCGRYMYSTTTDHFQAPPAL